MPDGSNDKQVHLKFSWWHILQNAISCGATHLPNNVHPISSGQKTVRSDENLSEI